MASYGKNFEFRVTPDAQDRNGQCVTPTTGDRIPIGAPIEIDLTKTPNALGLQPVKLSTAGGTSVPTSGLTGILVYEEVIYRGVDPALTTYSNTVITTAPLGAAVQLVSSPDLVVVFRNTAHQTFLGGADIPARMMVAGFGATPTVDVGDYLKPGTGSDAAGYWDGTDTRADAWLVVTAVNHDRGEVEARMLI